MGQSWKEKMMRGFLYATINKTLHSLKETRSMALNVLTVKRKRSNE